MTWSLEEWHNLKYDKRRKGAMAWLMMAEQWFTIEEQDAALEALDRADCAKPLDPVKENRYI